MDKMEKFQAQMATSRLEEAMAELSRSQVEISQPPQVQRSPLEEAMAKLARSQAEYASLRAEMENS